MEWPKLKRILANNGIRLGEDVPPVISTSAGPYAFPVPSSAQGVDFHQAQTGPFGIHHHLPLHLDPRYTPFPQGYTTQHSTHMVHQTITPLSSAPFMGGYSPPFPQHCNCTVCNPHIAYGHPPPYPPAFASPSDRVYPPSTPQYEQYTEDYLHPGYNNRPHSPIEGSHTQSFDGEPADQGSSTNPFAGNRYHNDQSSSFNHNHYDP
jgi:hypothetical protein